MLSLFTKNTSVTDLLARSTQMLGEAGEGVLGVLLRVYVLLELAPVQALTLVLVQLTHYVAAYRFYYLFKSDFMLFLASLRHHFNESVVEHVIQLLQADTAVTVHIIDIKLHL